MKDLSLKKIKSAIEEVFRDRNKQITVSIHLSTDMPKQKKGAILLSKQGKYEILIGGHVKFLNVLEVVAHEATHIIVGFEHGQEFDKEKEKIMEVLKKKLNIN